METTSSVTDSNKGNNQLISILNRIDSRHLASLWQFYRDYFPSDAECLEYFATALNKEPETTDKHTKNTARTGVYVGDTGATIDEKVFIPRRMLNAVMRLVSAARDMEQIRQGKDVFKIVCLITCVETLQILSGNDESKGKMVISFFKDNISKKIAT